MDRAPLPPPDPSGLSIIANRLKDPMFPSKAVVEIDSIVVSSLFGQRAKKKEKRTHLMQTLSRVCVVDEETRESIYSVFEQGKENLVFGYPWAYLETAKQMAGYLYRSSGLLKSQGPESRAIIEWCIAAYSTVINPESSVKLSCVKMGPTDTLGFAIHAVAEIKNGQIIHELVGLMPKDGKAKHSGVSCITPSSYHNQPTHVERVLFGPVRFINHICLMPNVEYIAVHGSSGFCVAALRDINPGEELLVDYGKEWFSDEPGGCPCLACKPSQQGTKRQTEEKNKATIQAEIKVCRKAKRKRTKERKKEKWSEQGGRIAGPSGN